MSVMGKKGHGGKAAQHAPAFGNDAPRNSKAARTPLGGSREHGGRGAAGKATRGSRKGNRGGSRKAASVGGWNA